MRNIIPQDILKKIIGYTLSGRKRSSGEDAQAGRETKLGFSRQRWCVTLLTSSMQGPDSKFFVISENGGMEYFNGPHLFRRFCQKHASPVNYVSEVKRMRKGGKRCETY